MKDDKDKPCNYILEKDGTQLTMKITCKECLGTAMETITGFLISSKKRYWSG